jgi:hypothetical protein
VLLLSVASTRWAVHSCLDWGLLDFADVPSAWGMLIESGWAPQACDTTHMFVPYKSDAQLVQLVLNGYNLVAALAAGGVPCCDQQQFFGRWLLLGGPVATACQQCRSCCVRMCLLYPPPNIRCVGGVGAWQ